LTANVSPLVTNTLAYYRNEYITTKKFYNIDTWCKRHIYLFPNTRSDKLECSSLARLFPPRLIFPGEANLRVEHHSGRLRLNTQMLDLAVKAFRVRTL